MDYCIKNYKNVYIKLNNAGQPVTCVEKMKGTFEYSKAKNIINNLPKHLRRMGFKEEAILEIKPKSAMKTIKKDDYKLSIDVTRWIEKFGNCADIFDEAKQREMELVAMLKNVDNEILDVLHYIELENPKDMYKGWLCYSKIRENRIRRREIKDEILVIEKVLEEINPNHITKKEVQKTVEGLLHRKYTFRILEEGEIGENGK